MKWSMAAVIGGLAMIVGCEGGNEPAKPGSGAGAGPARAATDNRPPTPPAPAREPIREKAEVGVGAKGRDLGMGPVSTPVRALFRTQQRLVFEVEIPKAAQLYKATEGRAPKTHEEFMEKIIKANSIVLPKLPAGYRYRYDPATEELMVEH